MTERILQAGQRQRIRIVGDGTRAGTHVFVGRHEMRGVQKVSFTVDSNGVASAHILVRGFIDIDIDAMSDLEIERT